MKIDTVFTLLYLQRHEEPQTSEEAKIITHIFSKIPLISQKYPLYMHNPLIVNYLVLYIIPCYLSRLPQNLIPQTNISLSLTVKYWLLDQTKSEITNLKSVRGTTLSFQACQGVKEGLFCILGKERTISLATEWVFSNNCLKDLISIRKRLLVEMN